MTPSACRRTSERLNFTMPVVLIASHYGTALVSRGVTTDVSEGGMRVNVEVVLQDGQPVSVEFDAPTMQQTLKLQAQVKHRHSNVYGLQFDEPTDQQKHQIRLIIGNA
ncbi:MAG TPA: PilZ domain-containing protein [Terriglobales bacterium]|nr:PilZ domain-containing protein [Terriglobales bacterium]